MARVRLADLNGPKMDLFRPFARPKWTILVHFGLANAKIRFGIRSFFTKMVVWTILDHFGPVHFPTVLRPLPIVCCIFQCLAVAGNRRKLQETVSCSLRHLACAFKHRHRETRCQFLALLLIDWRIWSSCKSSGVMVTSPFIGLMQTGASALFLPLLSNAWDRTQTNKNINETIGI